MSDAHCHRGLDTEQQNVKWSWRLRWEEVAHYWFYWLSAPLLCVHFVLWCEPGCCYQSLLRWWGQDDKILPPIRNHLNVPCVQKWQILWSHCSSQCVLKQTPATVPPTALAMSVPGVPMAYVTALSDVWSLGIIGSVSANTAPEKQASDNWEIISRCPCQLSVTETCLSRICSGSLYLVIFEAEEISNMCHNGGGMWRCAAEDRGQLCRVTMMTMTHDGPTQWPL